MNKLKRTQRVIGLTIFTVLTGFSINSIAGGFQLFESNVTNLGNAYAGTGAEAADASTEFYNPAGMTLLNNPQVVASGTWIDVDVKAHLNNATSTISTPNSLTFNNSFAVEGDNNVNPGGSAVVPSFHFVYPLIAHKLAFGLGVNSPFGLQTLYPQDSMVRYLATKSRVMTIDISPSVAYQATSNFSLGVGIDDQYLKASFDQAIPPLSPLLGTQDGYFTNTADGWGWGWHGGILYQFTPTTRVGLDYHSKIKHKLNGDALLTTNIDSDPLPFIGSIKLNIGTPGSLSTTITLPDYWDLSLYHAFNSAWAILASLDYTLWDKIQNVTVNYGGDLVSGPVSLPSANLPFGFQNTWRAALGLDYKPAEKWTLRTGIAYDESPVPNEAARTFRLPDANRFWIAFGAQYIINSQFTVDAGYSHLFVKSDTVNNTQNFDASFSLPPIISPEPLILSQNGMGTFDSSVNEVGLQLTWNIPNA